MSSSPLFASVAESTVIFGPIDHVGCARASSTVTDSRSASDRFRKGPPEAVSTIESTRARGPALEALEDRGVLAVDGQKQPSSPLPCPEREVAGGDEALLVRERESDAPLERPERRADSGEADDRVEHEVGLVRLRAARRGRRRPGCARRRAARRGRRAASSPTRARRRRAPGSRRSPRAPGDRSSRSRRAALFVSRPRGEG